MVSDLNQVLVVPGHAKLTPLEVSSLSRPDALQALMGSKAQSIAPFEYAFHGTEPHNNSSILKDGMLPEKRRAGGDWFATDPHTSIAHSRPVSPTDTSSRVYKILLFLLLPVAPAVQHAGWCYSGVIVMSDHHFELSLATITYEAMRSGTRPRV
jgi:hypothetical protein